MKLRMTLPSVVGQVGNAQIIHYRLLPPHMAMLYSVLFLILSDFFSIFLLLCVVPKDVLVACKILGYNTIVT